MCDHINRKEYRASEECDDEPFEDLDDQKEAYEGMIRTLMDEKAKGTWVSLTLLPLLHLLSRERLRTPDF